MMESYSHLSLKFLKEQKKRTALNILGVLMSAALITGTGTIIESVKQQMINNAIAKEGNFHAAFKNINREQAHVIANHIDVLQSCTGRIGGFAVLAETGNDEIPYRLLRINENDSEAMEMLQVERGLSEGRLPEKPGEIAIEARVLKTLGSEFSIGSTVTLPMGQRRLVGDKSIITEFMYPLPDDYEGGWEEYFDFEGEQSFTICGILKEDFIISKNYSSNGVVLREAMSSMEMGVFHMLVLFTDLEDVKGTAEALADSVGLEKENIVYNHRLLNVSGKSLNQGFRDSIVGFQSIVTLIIVIATIAVIYNSFNISMIERIAQFGLLRCVGSTPSQIRRLILREAGLICLLAVPTGILTGFVSMKALFFTVDKMSNNILFEGIEVAFVPQVILYSFLICSATVFASAFVPAMRAGSIPPVEAVRSTGMFSHDRIGSTRLTGPGSSFSLLMAARNIGRNRRRFAVTLFSMVVSVVLFVSFGGMMRLVQNSNIVKEENYPGLKLEAEIFVEKSVLDELKALDSVDLLIQYRQMEVSLSASPDRLSDYYTRYVEALETFEKRDGGIVIPHCRILSYGDEALVDFARGDTLPGEGEVVLLNQGQFFTDKGIKAFLPNSSFRKGESITLEINGLMEEFQVGAVWDKVYYEDYNPVEGGIDFLVSQETFNRLSGDQPLGEVFIRLKEGSSNAEVLAYLDELTNRKIGYEYVDAQAQAEDMTRETMVIGIFFYGFIIVIALISCLNIVNTISTNLLLRSREFGIIQAVGLHKGGLRRMVLMESLIYSISSLLLGGIMGTGIWYLLVREMSNIRLTAFQAPWIEMGIAAIALMIITLLSGYIPLRKIHLKPIIENIRMEE